MKILIMSQLGETSDLAYRLQKEGHEVIFNILTKGEGQVGRGLVHVECNRVPDLSADLIINDDVFLGQTSDKLRKAGKVVLGGSEITDRLENDRKFGMDIMRACGIRVPKSFTFTSFSSAVAFLKKNPGRYVFKPHGQEDRFFTHVSRDTEELLAMLEYYQQIWPNGLTFELQEFMVGIEMAIGGWFNGTQFCKPVLPNFEIKRLMNDNIGPSVDMGAVMAYRTHSKLFQETLAKTEMFLKTTGYRGFLDIACIVNGNDAYGIEWTARPGFPTIQIQDEVHKKGTWGDFLYKLAQGLTDEVPADTAKWDVGVAVCALPWPQKSEDKKFKDVPIFFPKNMEHIHTRDLWLDNGQYKQAGMMGYICLCTGSDVTIEKAQKKAYKVVDTVHVPGGFYRTDVGESVMEDLPTLKAWGWLR